MNVFRACGTVFFSAFIACGSASEGEREAPVEPIGVDTQPGFGQTTNVTLTDPTLASCASTVTETKLDEANLVFMVDQSNSMGDTRARKWNPVVAATKQFFLDAGSAGLKASMDYFPETSVAVAGNCAAATYASPEVMLAALPSVAFGLSLDQHAPGMHNGTPTLAALSGALTYAKTLVGRTAVVLVTDGDPAGCSDDRVSSVAARAAIDAAKIKTYVVGVGANRANLDAIARGGGTDQSIMVSVGDPEATNRELLAAFTRVREETSACDAPLPAAPAGETLDFGRVNVVWTSSATEEVLSYSADCTTSGWHYDNEIAPSTVALCPAACANAKRTSGKLAIAFGCATKNGVR